MRTYRTLKNCMVEPEIYGNLNYFPKGDWNFLIAFYVYPKNTVYFNSKLWNEDGKLTKYRAAYYDIKHLHPSATFEKFYE